MKALDLPPYAPTLMESTRAIGYSIEAAIADIIDNSIAASASRVDIDFFPIGEAYIAILDDGWGMSSEELISAMQYGSRNPLETRDENDLGRYGLGMKTASLSQCRILTVLSKKSGILTGAQWNLNHIQQAESWSLLVLAEEAKEYPSFDKLNQYENGTLVIWQDLDKFAVGENDIAEAFTRKMELIREHLSLVFHRYLNIFIDSNTDEATRDLFPKDFLTVLPTPELYIGADKIFGNGDADEWDDGIPHTRTGGIYGDSIIPIQNEEQESFYVFKHKKELADELYDLPGSMRKAIRYFMLACTISDIRQDNMEHRSMLINVSRFTKVQNVTADLVEAYVSSIKADLENYSALPVEKAMQIKNIAALYAEWEDFHLAEAAKITWESFLHDFLLKSAKRIEVRSVNQQHGASSLNYYEYKGVGMRVIAVGGNSLSRGLTLEGLCVSYFYRNTMMYDTLLQMGRWFGYRPNYDDLFKVWMAEDAIDWYGYITDAINELKDELRKMKRQNQTPEEFGLKVRQAPGSLLITARNKMRTATSVKRPITVSGRMIETPRLKGDAVSVRENEALCRSFIESISAEIQYEYDSYTKAFIWRNVPKKAVTEIVRSYITHPWNLNFQPEALAEYIAADEGPLEFWDVAIPQDADESQTIKIDLIDGTTVDVHPKGRPLEWDLTSKNMLKVYGRHVRIGSGGCTKIGLSEQRIKDLRKEFGSSKDSTYLHTERNPLLLIHVLTNTNTEMKPGDPKQVFALGLGFPYDGNERTANYMVNVKELKNWVDIEDEDDDDEND